MNNCLRNTVIGALTAVTFAIAGEVEAQQSTLSQPLIAQARGAASANPAAQPSRVLAQARPAAPAAAGAAAQPVLLGQFGDWGAYTASPGGKKVCFALAKPKSSQTVPPNRPRDPIYMFISSRPAEKVKDEVSVVIGYGFKPNTDASLDLGGAQYAMYTQADGAWIKNAAEEPRLVEAMRKGSELTIKGTSSRGTATIDVFSLKGVSQALDRVAQECK